MYYSSELRGRFDKKAFQKEVTTMSRHYSEKK